MWTRSVGSVWGGGVDTYHSVHMEVRGPFSVASNFPLHPVDSGGPLRLVASALTH